MPPDVKPVTVSQPESWYNPNRLKFEALYTELSLGDNAPKFSGPGFQASVGRAFELSLRNHLFFDAIFRTHSLKSQNNDPLTAISFGLGVGYELQIFPKILGAYAYGNILTNFWSTTGVKLESNVRRAFDNQATLALEAGAGINFARGIFTFSGGYQSNPTLEIPHSQPGVAPRGYTLGGYVLKGGIDVANAIHWGIKEFPTQSSFKEWIGGTKIYALADSSYTFNFRQPSNGENSLRIFDKRSDRPMWNYYEVAVERPIDDKTTLGYRVDFGFGENSAVARAKSSFSGDKYDLQQLYAQVKLPVGIKIVEDGKDKTLNWVVTGGKKTLPIGDHVIESALNFFSSNSWLFGFGQPFTGLGAFLDIPFPKSLSLHTGVFNGFDNVLDRSAGLSGLASFTVKWLDLLPESTGKQLESYLKARDLKIDVTSVFSGTVGKENERLRGLFDVVNTFSLRDKKAQKKEFDRLTLSLNFTIGHENEGAGMGPVDWLGLSLSARLFFVKQFGIAARGEFFYDPQGFRTGTPQTMWETTATMIIKPWDWLLIRPEYRHDQSNQRLFVTSNSKIKMQDTLAISLAFLYGY